MAAAEAERNLFKGKYRSIVTLLDTTRQQIQEIFDHVDDEGDRRYFGSTNHVDWLRGLLDEMDRWSIDAMLPKGDINKMEADPYAEIRAQRARAEAAEAEVRRRAPSPQPNMDPALVGIAEEMKESGGHWQPCTGCYDTEDGHPTQKYDFSQSLRTSIGCGCHECGGLGAVWWHMTDEEVEDFARACEEVDIEHRLTVRIARLEFALRGLSKAYADCNGEDHPAYEEAQRLLAGSPSPETNKKGNGEAAIIECLAAGQSFIFDPATNFLHADDGTVQGIRYIAEHGDLPQSRWPASDWAIARIKELEAQAVPEGWQLVPKEPTQEMCEAAPSLPAINAIDDLPLKKSGWSMSAIVNRKRYLAMLAAAPAKQEGGADGC